MNCRRSVVQLFRETAQRRRLRPWERKAMKFFQTPAAYTFLEAYMGEDVQFSGVMPKAPGSASDSEDEDEKSRRLLSRIKAVLDEAEDDSMAMRKLRSMLAELEAEEESEDERRTDEDEDEQEAEGRRPGVDDEPESVSVGWKGAHYAKHSERSDRADESAVRIFNREMRRTRESSRGVQRGDFRTGF